MENKKQVAIYIRVSTLDQAREGYSLDAQEKRLGNGVRNGNIMFMICMQIKEFQGRILNIDQI